MPKSILVVDDSDMMRKLILKNLKLCSTDIVVQEASDGLKALDKIKEHLFDLIITDWNMPNMNGLELITEVRKTNKTIQIIMITTEGRVEKVKQAVLAGASNYIAKPFTEETFKAKFSKIL